MNKATLNRRIEAFLKTKKKSDGGYAAVDPKEVEALDKIVQALLELKYEGDSCGFFPIEVSLVDRTRYERPAKIAIRYTDKPVDGLSVAELHQKAAQGHSILAAAATAAVVRHVQELQQTVDNRWRLNLDNAFQVAALPDGRTTRAVADMLLQAMERASKKIPCPADTVLRREWAQSITEEVAKKANVGITWRTCMRTPNGARMWFDLPQFDLSIEFESGQTLDQVNITQGAARSPR